MKKLVCIVFISILWVPFIFSQDIISSQIKEVTLFTNQALIKREAKLRVKKGLNELFLELEAFRVDKDSVSAKVFGKGDIFSVQFKEIYLKEAPQENIKTLEQKIKELKKSRRILLEEKDVLSKKEMFLKSVMDFSQTQVPQDMKTIFPKIEDLERTLVFLDGNFKSINEKKQSLDYQIEEINKEIEVLEKELASLKRPQDQTKKVIEILFDSQKDQEIRVEASYLVYNASWQPIYKVDVPLTLEEVNLVMFSKIKQKTGEDWKNITLSVSNVIPLKGVGLPLPGTWFLNLRRYGPREKVGGAYEAYHLESKALMPKVSLEEKEVDFAYAQKKEFPLSFEYQLPQVLNIESKDKETTLPLFSKTIIGKFFHYAVPKVNALTFLVCRVSADKELLSGSLNVHFGGRFIGKTFLREKKADEEFDLSLGADRDVKVKREKIKDKIRETFFGKIERQTVIRELVFKITVENLKEKPITVKILDSIPVSKTDKVEIKDIKISPQPSQRDYQDREGVMLWEFELKSREKEEINIEFVITHPKNIPLFGL